MGTKTKLFAQRNVAIAGKHFAENDEIKGVDAEQLVIAERSGWIGPKKTAAANVAPDEGDAGAGDGEGDGGGEGGEKN